MIFDSLPPTNPQPPSDCPALNVLDLLKGLPNQTALGLEWLNRPDADRQYPYYAKVFHALRPYSFLEIGTYLGYGIAALVASKTPAKQVHWVDSEEYLEGSNDLAFDNVKSLTPNSEIEFGWWETKEEVPQFNYSLIHVDGDHSYDGCYRDLVWAFGRRAKTLIGHDIFLESDIRRAVVDFCNENGLFYATVNDFTHGLYVISQCDFFDAVARLSTAGVGPVTIHPPWVAKNVV